MSIFIPRAAHIYPLKAIGSVPSSLLTGLISYWKLDEVSAGVAPVTRVDSVVVSANDLTDTNNTPSGTGIISNGASFTSVSSQQLSRVSNASLRTGDIDFTVSCWLNLSVAITSTTLVIGKTTSLIAANTEWSIRGNGVTNVRLQVSDGATLTSVVNPTVLTPSVWYFIVIYHDSVNNIISISINNGIPVTAAYSAGILINGSSLFFGGSVATTFLNGILDEIGFWKRILTPAEITSLYNAGSGLTYPF